MIKIIRDTLTMYLDTLYPETKMFLYYKNDYELLIAITLSSQTLDSRVNDISPYLFDHYPDVFSLSQAEIQPLVELLKPLGMANKKSEYIIQIASQIVSNYEGVIPRDYQALISLPGVGSKTANVFLSVLGYKNYFGVDTHIARIAKRLELVDYQASVDDVRDELILFFLGEDLLKRHLQLISFGRAICKAISPNCSECELKSYCAFIKHKKENNSKLLTLKKRI
jgi:endonuclease-3